MAEQPTTELVFTAQLGTIKIVTPKDSYDSNRGALEMTLRVQAPVPPRKPELPWKLREKAPAEPTKKKGEAEPTFLERQKEYENTIKVRTAAQNNYEQDMEKYQQTIELLHGRLLSYAQLVGFSAVIGAKPITVRITPEQQDLLPGFSVALLSEGSVNEP